MTCQKYSISSTKYIPMLLAAGLQVLKDNSGLFQLGSDFVVLDIIFINYSNTVLS